MPMMDAVDFALKYGYRPRKVSEIHIDFDTGHGKFFLGADLKTQKEYGMEHDMQMFNPVEVAMCLRELAYHLEQSQREGDKDYPDMFMSYANYDEGKFFAGWEDKCTTHTDRPNRWGGWR